MKRIRERIALWLAPWLVGSDWTVSAWRKVRVNNTFHYSPVYPTSRCEEHGG